MALYLAVAAMAGVAAYVFTRKSALIPEGPALVLVHSPNCGHCVQMKPEWDKLGSSVEAKGLRVPVITVNGLDDPSRAKALETDAFPNVVFVDGGKNLIKFTGERTSENFIEFVKSHL